MRVRALLVALVLICARLLSAETAKSRFEPLPAEAFMKAAAGEFGTEYIPAGEFRGEKSQMLQEVLARFSKAGYLGDYRYYVMPSNQWNAFASAGTAKPDIVCVLTGLLSDMQSPDELAGVLAHEIAHNNHQDGTDAMMKTVATAIISDLVFDEKEDEAAQPVFVSIMSLGFSRTAESRADREALFMMTRLGYNPESLVALWERTAKKDPMGLPKILLDHPPSASRARDLGNLTRRHLQQREGTWIVVSEPENTGGGGMATRFRRGAVTGLYSGGIGAVTEVITEKDASNLLPSSLRWAGAGFMVGFLFDTDFPPTLRLQRRVMVSGRDCQLELRPEFHPRSGELTPAVVFNVRF